MVKYIHTLPVVMMPTAIICYQNLNRLCAGMYNELYVCGFVL